MRPRSAKSLRTAQVFKAGERIAAGEDGAGISGKAKPIADPALAQLRSGLVGVGSGVIDGAVCFAVAVVVDDQRALVAGAVGIGKDVLVHRTGRLEEIVEQKIVALGKDPATLQQRSNLALVALHKPMVRRLVVARPLVLHAVLLGESLNLPVAEHRQARQRGHHGRHAEAFVALAELVNCRSFIRIAHEVHVALHDVGIELESVLDDRAVLGILLVAQHLHERAVVDAMHAQGADKVALHQPESLGQQQRSGHLGGHAIHHFAPEFVRHVLVEFGLAHAVFGARWNGAARARPRKPQPMKMPLGQRHRRVEANHRKQPRHIQNGLDHLFAHRRIQVVELRGVVPRKAGAVVAVIDVARLAGPAVAAAKNDSSVGLLEVVIFDLDFDAASRARDRDR